MVLGKLRFAVVGTGHIAKQHVQALLSCGQDLVGVCNRHPEKAMEFMQNFSGYEEVAPAVIGETVFSDLGQMLDTVKPDVLYVTTPHLSHVDLACQAVRRGIHCIIEKPLDISLAKAQYLKEEAARNHVLVSVIAQSRFMRPCARIINAIADGKLGKPSFGQVSVLAWRDEDYYRSNAWRGTWAAEGGGVLVNQSVHELDLLCAFLGEVDQVYGQWRNVNHPYIEVDDTAMAVVTFKSGAIANIVVSNSVNPAQDAYVHITGSNGHTVGIRTHQGAEAQAGIRPSHYRPVNDVFTLMSEEQLAEYTKSDYADISEESWSYHFFAEQVKEMVRAIEHQRNGMQVHLSNDINSAMGCMTIFNGIYLSQKLGRPVTIDEILSDSMEQLVNPSTPAPAEPQAQAPVASAPAAAPAAVAPDAVAAAEAASAAAAPAAAPSEPSV